MAAWLVCSFPDRAVRVPALAGVPGSSSSGSSPGGGQIVLCSWGRHVTLTMLLSIQEYKPVPANFRGKPNKLREVTCDRLASRLGGAEILLPASCNRNQDKLR